MIKTKIVAFESIFEEFHKAIVRLRGVFAI